MKNIHEKVEKNIGLFVIFTILAISIGGLVEITPLFFQKATTTPVDNLKPYTALQMEGRDIYIREGCNNCHSQMIRPFRAETERYGHYSVAGEQVWEHPFLWGSKRTGPDLARVGGRYSDDWHKAHLYDPRSVVPDQTTITGKKLETFNWLTRNRSHKDENGNAIPLYTQAEIDGAGDAVKGRTEMDALVAYLQSLGHALK